MGGTKYPNFRQDWRCNHNVTSSDLADVAFFDPSTGSFLKKCDKARYMAMTDWLKGLLGLQMVGPEMLAGFFQTNLLSVRQPSLSGDSMKASQSTGAMRMPNAGHACWQEI